ncbi:MAG: hypothetical protein IPK85_12995 [Gemmatimonadetes bacterium]|nr:hypothetical protein [Gemmatimonadota bacterium]
MSFTVVRITTVLVVPSVEPSLAFWEGRLGFTKVAEVPHGDALGFAMLVKEGVEVMLQSEASVGDDLPASAREGGLPGRSAALFIEVSDLAAVEAALGDWPIAMPRRTTFYGMHEVGVREPGGHMVTFAQKAAGG